MNKAIAAAARLARRSVTDALTNCRIWQGARDRDGYGQTFYDGKRVKAHRLAWQLVNGPIPDGLLICHECDNPPCINEEHLFEGTNLANKHDAMRKGRHAHGAKFSAAMVAHRTGEKNPAAVLTEDAVRWIKAALLDGKRISELAQFFGVSFSCVADISHGRTWRHLQD